MLIIVKKYFVYYFHFVYEILKSGCSKNICHIKQIKVIQHVSDDLLFGQ
jgi:hypothetical protein